MPRPLEAVFAEHADTIRAYLATQVRYHDLDDTVADVFADAIAAGNRLPDNELDWLLDRAITHGRAKRDAYAQQNQGHHARIADHASIDHPGQLLIELAEALRTLSDDEREVLGLAMLGLDSGAAARLAGCSRNAYRVRLHRARTRLRRTLTINEGDTA